MLKNFIKSRRFLLWLAAAGMAFGSGVCFTGLKSQYGADDAGTGAAVFTVSLLIWKRAEKKEREFEQSNAI